MSSMTTSSHSVPLVAKPGGVGLQNTWKATKGNLKGFNGVTKGLDPSLCNTWQKIGMSSQMKKHRQGKIELELQLSWMSMKYLQEDQNTVMILTTARARKKRGRAFTWQSPRRTTCHMGHGCIQFGIPPWLLHFHCSLPQPLMREEQDLHVLVINNQVKSKSKSKQRRNRS